jgi:hypothetical protein
LGFSLGFCSELFLERCFDILTKRGVRITSRAVIELLANLPSIGVFWSRAALRMAVDPRLYWLSISL